MIDELLSIDFTLLLAQFIDSECMRGWNLFDLADLVSVSKMYE